MAQDAAAPAGAKLSSVMYNWRVAAVHNALARRGKAEGPLTVDDLVSLGHLDQYHYLGTQACDEVIDILGLEPGSTLLDVGAGIGGPARYIAARSGCSVTGVELQADLAKAAAEFTARAGLAERVRFEVGDFTELGHSEEHRKRLGDFGHLMCLLSFCHFPQRDLALKACHECLRPGGTFLIEDLALVGASFTEQESKDLRDVVSAPSVTSPAAYVAGLEAAGFVDVEVVDLTVPWVAWTKARHESFRDAKEETSKLHGEDHYKDRVSFYEVVDRLFAGGNLGGVRITGRRPTVAEAKLRQGRLRAAGRSHTGAGASLNELGSTVAGAASDATVGGTFSTEAYLAQPLLPAGPRGTDPGFHDSLQYHFFLPGYIIAARVFHTTTLQQHSAWMYDVKKGEMTELFTPSYEVMAQRTGQDTLQLESEKLKFVDAPEGGVIEVKSKGLVLNFKQNHVYSWLPQGQTDSVVHRPDLSCTVTIDGKVLQGTGYSKRYWGIYERFWGYRFIHGTVSLPGDARPHTVWTADAAFGDSKYNYFKLLDPSGNLASAESDDTWQRDTTANALVGGVRHTVTLRPLCTWNAIIGGPGKSMESKMQNRYCEMELAIGGRVLRGVAYNERCYGTVG